MSPLRNTLLTLACLTSPALALDTVIVFNEVQYHPADENDPTLEFVELYNQNSVNIDLSGWRVSGEIDFTFPEGTSIEGDSYLVIAANPTVLENASGQSGFLGPFTGNLGNGGGTLRIRNNNNRILDELTYNDRAPWPIGADGSGASLSKRTPLTTTDSVNNWTPSLLIGGTPGTENFPSSSTPPPSGSNVALGKAVINGSSAYNGLPFDQGAFPAQRVTDGSTTDVHSSNYWLGTNGDPTQFFILDLGTEYDITEIHLRNTHNDQWNDRGTLNFTVSASTSVNGSNLLLSPQTILTGTLSNVANQNPIEADVFTAGNGLTETTARYLRFDSLTAVQNNAGLNEIEVYTSDTPPPVVSAEDIPLTINEIAGTNDAMFWVELHNHGAADLDLTGCLLTFEDAGEYQFPATSTIPANDFLLIPATTLALPAAPLDGENLYLYQPGKVTLIDAVRIDDLPIGRSPDSSGNLLTISQLAEASPGATNIITTTEAIVINEIMYHHRPTYLSPGDPPAITLINGFDWDATWRFNQSGDDLGNDWANSSHPSGGNWESGTGPLGYETSAGLPPEPIVTELNRPQSNDPRVITFYFESDFNVDSADLTEVTALRFSHQTDDGAVYYLNGQEIHRFDMPDGGVTASTLAVNNTAVEADAIRTFSVGPEFLVSGQNRLSVEVHQSSSGSSDIVMGLKLDLEISLPGANPPTPFTENNEEWIELYNRSNSTVSLENWELDGAVGFTFPVGTEMAPGSYLVIARDLADFTTKFPGVDALGGFSGTLANSGEKLRLLDQWNNPVDEVSYLDGAPWPKAADGGGSSLELRHPDLDNTAPTSWAASSNDDTSSWKNYSYTVTAATPTYRPAQNSFHEIRLGLLDAGEALLDDFSVIEDPGGNNLELIANGSFDTTTGWRLLGTHQDSHVVNDEGNNVLKVSAVSRMNYLNNLIESNLTSGGSLREVTPGTTYQVSFRAKWLSGSPQFRFELYYNKLAELVILDQPETHGTPGSQNSTYTTAVGPTLTGLIHQPAVPSSSEPITISVEAGDPEGLDTVALKYSVNAGVFQTAPMTSADGSHYTATIPSQTNNAIVQFYVEALDLSGNTSFAPPLGPDSRALIKVTSPNTGGAKQAIRVNMLTAEANAMHVERDILDNKRRGCTIIINEEEIAYNSGIRLRGSMWSRRTSSRVGFNLKLPSDKLYRGVHSTITLRNGNRRELAVKHIINAAGGLHDNYNDIVQFNGHLSTYNSRSRLEMTRFGGDYLDGLPGGDGADGTVFKMEGIRVFEQTQDGSRNTPKVPFPIGWVSSFDLADQGDLKEDYRHNLRINTALDRDDYSGVINMAKFFSLNGTILGEAAPDIINVDMWCRQFALLSLCGIGDTYSQGNPHNLNFYSRPDGLVEPMPWDWDFTFNRGTNSPLWGNKNVAKLFSRPAYTRLYHGHLHDLVSNTYNASYLTPWFNHLGTCAGENFSSSISYVTDRGNYVLSQLPAQIPFTITSNGGDNFEHEGSTVTLTGDAWINTKEIIIDGTPSPLPLTWLDANTWEVQVSLFPGENPLTLTALDFNGNPAGSDSITVTNTSTVEPASAANLVISEIHYHPADNDLEEFIELQNISNSTIDLSGATFTDGIDFEFSAGTLLAPGEHILVVLDTAAFQAKYGPGINIAGTFANATKLSNGGETIRLESPSGILIQEVTYDDANTWPSTADGNGPSLVLIDPSTNPDHALSSNWRTSTVAGGSPGIIDPSGFVGDPEADLDNDGFTAFAEYSMGTNDTTPGDALGLTTFTITTDGHWQFTFPISVNAEGITSIFEYSTNLETWNDASAISSLTGESSNEARFLQTHTSNEPATAGKLFVRVRYTGSAN